MERTVDADDVAAAIIEANPGLSQMELHKLLYLVQAASLAWHGEKAYPDRIEAWRYGPMVRGVAGHYMDAGYAGIEEPVAGDASALSPRLQRVVAQILADYGHLSGPTLARMCKGAGSPWRTVRGDTPETDSSNAEIDEDTMYEYHRVNGVVSPELTPEERRLIGAFLDDGNDAALAELFESELGQAPSVSSK